MKIIAYLLLALGIALGAFAYSMDTTVEASGQSFGSGEFAINVPKSRVHNIGLMEDRRLLFYGAGLSLVLGTAFLGIATVAGAKTATQSGTTPEGDQNQHYRFKKEQLQTKEEDIPSKFQWKCSKCGESHENEFLSCWNCGTDRA